MTDVTAEGSRSNPRKWLGVPSAQTMTLSEQMEQRTLQIGRWLTKRRSILLAPLFAVTLLSARWASSWKREVLLDLLGVFSLIAGARLRLAAASYHETGPSAEPITAGPYAWVRHPLYLANFLLGLGVVLIAGWLPMVAVYILFFLPVHSLVARSEEIHLIQLYGEKYLAYRREVPAVIPFRPFSGPLYGTPSDVKLKKGQEIWKTAGYLVGVAALLALKQWRGDLPIPTLQPIPLSGMLACAGAVVLAIALRARTKWSWLRTVETVVTVIGVLLMTSHVPGVWPALKRRF